KPDDIKQFKAKFGYDPLSVPISGGSYRHFGALDAVAFFVNKDNPIESITYKQLDQMYSTTHARGGAANTKWGDLGLTGEAPGKPMNPVTEEFLRFVLSREGQQVVLEHARYIPLRAWQANAARAMLVDGN